MKFFGNTADDYFDNPVSSYPWPTHLLIGLVKVVVWIWSKIYWHWTCDGPDPYVKTPEGQRGRVFICNHASMLDPALFVVRQLGTGCTVRPLYKSEFESSKVVTGLFARVGAMPVKRATADMKVIKRAVNCLKRGENILVFPEGTRVWDPDARPELFGGFSLIAQMAGAEVVPMAIDGSERINPDKRYRLPRPARVRVRFGEPISFDNVPGEGKKEKAANMEQLAMGRVYEMRSALRSELGRA